MDKISLPTLKGHSAGSRRKLQRQGHRLSGRPAGFDIFFHSQPRIWPLPCCLLRAKRAWVCLSRKRADFLSGGRISACTARVAAGKGTFLSFVFPSSWWVHFLDPYVALWRKLASWWHLSPHQQASRFGLFFCWWLNHFLSTSSFYFVLVCVSWFFKILVFVSFPTLFRGIFEGRTEQKHFTTSSWNGNLILVLDWIVYPPPPHKVTCWSPNLLP